MAFLFNLYLTVTLSADLRLAGALAAALGQFLFI
jgi:hypothetical protein